MLGGFFVNVKSRELMASSILYPRKTPGGREKRGEISQGEEEVQREGERSQREKKKRGRERSARGKKVG